MASSLVVLAAQAWALDELLPCRRQNARLWFSDLPHELQLAKAYCQPCPIRRLCLAGALERHEPHGVWGGEIFDRGAIITEKRPPGRPPRTAGRVKSELPARRCSLADQAELACAADGLGAVARAEVAKNAADVLLLDHRLPLALRLAARGATRCLEGTVKASRHVAWSRSAGRVAGRIVWACRPVSPGICHRWLP
jgi:WhiB family transcriptional regulator, redox-sensing transcriptional regulator